MKQSEYDSVVYVVDDDEGIRDYLRWLLEPAGYRVEAFASASEFLAAYSDRRPGCLLLDVNMPELGGFDVQARLNDAGIGIPVIMMTAYAEVPMAVRAMRAGAIDFVQKPLDGHAILERIREALAAAQRRFSVERERHAVQSALDRLTPRQKAVLAGLREGKPSKEIAFDLGLSPKTVDVHRFRIMQQLEAVSLPDLFRKLALATE